MLNIAEMRTGNWITTEGFLKPIQVTAHSFPKIKEKPHLSNPIEITPAIMELASFELKKSAVSKRPVSYWQKDFLIWHETGEVHLWTEREVQMDIIVKYVHSLQNIWYYLSGEELPISLNPDLGVNELYGLKSKKLT